MSLIKFGYTVDMEALQNPAIPESFFIGYDTDGVLKQLDHLGNLTPIGSVTNVIGAESNFFLSNSGLDSLGNKTASIYRSGNLRVGTTQSYTQMSGSTFSIYNNVGGTPSLYFSVDNSLVINNNNNISGDRFYWNPSSGLQFNNNIDSNFYSGFSSTGLSFSHTDSISSITSESVSITDGDYTLSLDINQGISFGNGTVSSVISATATLFTQTSSTLTLLPTTLSGNQVQYYQNKSGTFSLISDVIDSSLFYLTGSTNSVINSKTQSIYRTGNIGIGTASPSTKLHIFATQSGAFRLQDGTQGNNYILKSDSNGIASWTPLSSVGISGSASYIPKFTGTSSLGNSNFIDNGSSGSYKSADDTVAFILGSNIFLRLLRGQSSMDFSLGNPGATVPEPGIITSYNTHGLDIKSQGYLAFSSGTSYTEAMRISSNGYVGIGLTTAPSTKLHIYATQSGYGFRLQDGTEGGGYILTSNGIGMGSWTSSISVSKFQLTGGQAGYILTSDATGVGSWTSSSTAVSYWTATGSNIINSNPTGSVIINHPAGGAYDVAFKTATFIDYSGQSGFGVYNGGNVGGNYFYGAWFNVPVGKGIQDFTGFTRFYINSSSPYNWISNQPMVIGSTTSIPSIGTNRFVVSSSVGTASFIVNENGSVIINSATAMSGSKLFIQSSTSSTTIGSNVMLDLYNGDTETFDSISEIAFSQNGQPGALSPYSVGHRYALITGYATTGNNSTSIGGIKFSTRATTGVGLVTALVIDQNGSVYNTSRGSSNTIYGYQALLTTTASLYNTAIGYQSLYSNTTGEANTAIGWNSLLSNTIGSYNTSIGLQSLVFNTAAVANTAIGYGSLFSNTTVVLTINITNGGSGYTQSSTFSNVQLSYISGSTATTYPTVTVYVGTGGTVSTATLVTNGTGFKDTTTVMGANLGTGVTFSISVGTLNSGDNNTAVGYRSLYSNTTGFQNTAVGYQSLFFNKDSYQNTAIGMYSLFSNVSGSRSTSVGYLSLYYSTSGSNTAIGIESLYNNTTGFNNTSLGEKSLYNNTTGRGNIAFGLEAGSSISGTTTGATNSTNSVFIGYDTRPQLGNQTNQIVIGYGATGNGSNSVTLGNNSITRTYLKGSVVIADDTQGPGYILTSDTNGVASWTASFALGIIATSSNITTDTLDINGLSQRGRCIIIDNGTYSINLTVNGVTGFSSTYLKHGTASVTFVQGSGRTLVQVDGTVVLNGIAGSTATLLSYGTTDYLRINNA